ncbi:MAG: MarR family transcriptional regulator [Candidatus Omnitrophica bacterium]|nr:MarR family transcriptional regulator [Candidatus Omnitrophota bacterium]
MAELPQIAEEVALIGPRIGRRILNDIFQSSDISHAQLFVIMTLVHNGPSRSSDIGKELKVAPPTATGIIGRLEKSGYVQRLADKDDRRAVIVDLTPEGRKLAQKLRGIIVSRWTKILSKISHDDAEKYLELLKKISEAL